MIKENIKKVKDIIAETCIKCNRKTEDITVVAVSKTFDTAKIIEAYENGLKNFGENYVQEFLKKHEELSNKKDIKWHFIGHLQTNKIKHIYDKVHLLHTLDSIKLAEKLNNTLKKNNKVLNALIQINIGEDPNKYGINKEEITKFLDKVSSFKNLKIKGLMTITPFFDNPEKVRPFYREMKKIFDKVFNYSADNIEIKELSMGMTNDFHIAIEEGATIIRIGTAIFGKREYSKER